MSNFNAAFKSEISRVARKELRAELDPLRKTLAQYRTAVASLKQQLAKLEREVRTSAKTKGSGSRRQEVVSADPDASATIQRRFSAPRLAAHRAKLKLSAAAYARLVGVSPLSIYKWETGKVRPRASQIQALASVRSLTQAEIQERLSSA